MKMLVHRVPISPAEPFVLEDLKHYLRITPDVEDLDDAEITSMGWAAAAEFEHFSQVALLTQLIRVTIFDPKPGSGLTLPIGPAVHDTVPTVTIDGQPFEGFDFAGGLRPFIRWLSAYHDLTKSRINIEYQAGFGDSASDIPQDLAQAIMDQAALHFDGRSPKFADDDGPITSPHMARIGTRYRGVTV